MSEFTSKGEQRISSLTSYMKGLINGESGAKMVKELNMIAENFVPLDIVICFDNLINEGYKMEELKTPSNKLFNLLFKTLSQYESIEPKDDSILFLIRKDNALIKNKLDLIKIHIKQLNINPNDRLINKLKTEFEKLRKVEQHYIVMQNIIFPLIEKELSNYNCIKLLWSMQDDTRKYLEGTIESLKSNKRFDLEIFNQQSSKLYFNIHTIIFREEKVLIPLMQEQINLEKIILLNEELSSMKLAFAKNKIKTTKKPNKQVETDKINLSTGQLSLEQLELIFNHLPMDMTYVDEKDEVKFYSDPAHRIFPRTPSIIGRKVQNCHPPESVDVVNKIVESFKKNEKNQADFWIKMGSKYILIRYFAVRNQNMEYKGVLEVSQEISEIQKIEGERKLLDW